MKEGQVLTLEFFNATGVKKRHTYTVTAVPDSRDNFYFLEGATDRGIYWHLTPGS